MNPSPICGEEHHLLPQVGPEQFGQKTQVVVVTGVVTAIFILHLPDTSISVDAASLWNGCCNDAPLYSRTSLTCTVMMGPPF